MLLNLVRGMFINGARLKGTERITETVRGYVAFL